MKTFRSTTLAALCLTLGVATAPAWASTKVLRTAWGGHGGHPAHVGMATPPHHQHQAHHAHHHANHQHFQVPHMRNAATVQAPRGAVAVSPARGRGSVTTTSPFGTVNGFNGRAVGFTPPAGSNLGGVSFGPGGPIFDHPSGE